MTAINKVDIGAKIVVIVVAFLAMPAFISWMRSGPDPARERAEAHTRNSEAIEQITAASPLFTGGRMAGDFQAIVDASKQWENSTKYGKELAMKAIRDAICAEPTPDVSGVVIYRGQDVGYFSAREILIFD